MPVRRATWQRVPPKTFYLPGVLNTPIHLSNGDIFTKLWNNFLLKIFFKTFEPCVQTKKFRTPQGT